jgi:hypothetical protein
MQKLGAGAAFSARECRSFIRLSDAFLIYQRLSWQDAASARHAMHDASQSGTTDRTHLLRQPDSFDAENGFSRVRHRLLFPLMPSARHAAYLMDT